jgi:hypothetical protein
MAGEDALNQREKLATFVHVSDLHIGDIDPVNGDALVSPLAATVFSNTRWMDGLLGHHGRALQDLAAFFVHLQHEKEEAKLIVTGDYSRCGSNSELQLAADFIQSHIDLNPPLQNFVGLGLGPQKLSIPGNHDQWGGSFQPLGGTPSQYHTVFPRPLPFLENVQLSNGKRIVFICIDSDADVSAWSSNRARAIGSFQNELSKLQSRLPIKSPNDIRILLVHHSWDQQGWTLRMDKPSKDALAQFLYSYEISAILTGHSHAPLLQPFTASSSAGRCGVHELRSGTTTQHDVIPLKWRTLMNRRPQRQPQHKWWLNTLLVHRLYQTTLGGMEWESKVYTRGRRGFKPLGVGDLTFPL